MNNKKFTFLIAMILVLFCSCGSANRTNPTNSSDSETTEGRDVETTESRDEGLGFKALKDKYNCTMLFLTTADGSSYYLYDDEVDYSQYFFLFFIAYNTTGVGFDMSLPYLNKAFDVPNVGNVPEKVKAEMLNLYYDKRGKTIYRNAQGYGFQEYYFDLSNGHCPGAYTFCRYKKEPNDKLDEVPDNALMFHWGYH